MLMRTGNIKDKERQPMATPRSDVFLKDRAAWYHCTSRCVRRGFHMGQDRATGRDFSHRKQWLEARLRQLSQVFAVDHAAYAVMDNHVHVVLRADPPRALTWSAEEVARRWLGVFPSSWIDADLRVPSNEAVMKLAADPVAIEKYRKRLGDLSWLMGRFKEWVARRANLEEQCKGRFWEQRYQCQRIADAGGLLACMIYVDLNPVRAHMVDRPEDSVHTSVRQRIELREKPPALSLAEGLGWLTPIEQIFTGESHDMPRLTLDDYLELLDAIGRRVGRARGRGTIPDRLLPILERLQLDEPRLADSILNFGRSYYYLIGSPDTLKRESQARGRPWRVRSADSGLLYRSAA
jgi:putative transposase